MVKAIRDNGGQVWYLMAKDEGHGLPKRRTTIFILGPRFNFSSNFCCTNWKLSEITESLIFFSLFPPLALVKFSDLFSFFLNSCAVALRLGRVMLAA